MHSDLTAFLPSHIPFYHLGELELGPTVSPAPAVPKSLDDLVALGFTIQGDLNAAMVVVFESGLNASMYAEAGNLVVSQLVTKLSNEQNLDLVVSAPLLLDEDRLQRLERGSNQVIERVYFHAHEKRTVPIRTFLFLGLASSWSSAGRSQ